MEFKVPIIDFRGACDIDGEMSRQQGESEVAYLVQIVDFMRKTLGWELIKQIHVDCLLLAFQKNDTEVSIVYDTMTGIELVTLDDTFDLESLFNEINNHMKDGL